MNNNERTTTAFWVMVVAILISSHYTIYLIGKEHIHDEIARTEAAEGRLLPRNILNITNPGE